MGCWSVWSWAQLSGWLYRSLIVPTQAPLLRFRKVCTFFPLWLHKTLYCILDFGRRKELKCLPKHFVSCSGIKKGQAITHVQKEDFRYNGIGLFNTNEKVMSFVFYSHRNWFCKVEVVFFYSFFSMALLFQCLRKGHHLSGHLVLYGLLNLCYFCWHYCGGVLFFFFPLDLPFLFFSPNFAFPRQPNSNWVFVTQSSISEVFESD